ncbi:MAG TPA: hypothetical protein VGB79_14090 [Allosphingosinicella sp.]|jgi:hypothetical protein
MKQEHHESPCSEEAAADPFSRLDEEDRAPPAAPPCPGLALAAHPEERPGEDEAASRRTAPLAQEAPARIGWFEGHMPENVDPLEPRHPETVFSQTRRLRHDGWSPEKMRLFLECFAECGVVVEACQAAGMSARAAYNLRDRDPLFAAGWDAAAVKARAPLADEAYSRARNGVVERIYRDGVVVAERHRYDNRLTMAVLTRLDSRLDRAEAQGAPHLALAARWDDYLAALGEDRREDGMALLAPAAADPAPAPQPAERANENVRDRALRELQRQALEDANSDEDPHSIWDDEDGWWTDYPPPPGFEGVEEGSYGDHDYRRSLSPEEQAVIDADIAQEEAEGAEEDAEALAIAAARRDAFFGFSPEPEREAADDED